MAGMSGNMVRTLKTATIIGQEINFAPRCRAKNEKKWKSEVKIREFEAFPREGFRWLRKGPLSAIGICRKTGTFRIGIYYDHTTADQDPQSLNWRRYRPLGRRRVTGYALAATRVAIAFQHYNITCITIFNRSMCFKGDKTLIVSLYIKGSYFSLKEALCKFKGRQQGDNKFRN